MDHRTTASVFQDCASSICQGLILAILAFPFAACARTPLAKPAPAPIKESDCFSISTLPEKRACLAKQGEVFIDDCERMRPMSCRPYAQMYAAEQTLRQAEANLVQSARQAYASYTDSDRAYLDDLAEYSKDASTAWQAYRDAQCALEPLAQGMARSESENLAEACRLAKTKARIAELEALKASTGQ
ncbi:MAG: lysozyme inhibitor LprI family protein [Pseudomonadota bacterium]